MNDTPVDLNSEELYPVGWGLLFKVVCAPSAWTPDQVSEEATRQDPPGTSVGRWVVSEPDSRDDEFDGVNRLPCPDCASRTRTHWLVNC